MTRLLRGLVAFSLVALAGVAYAASISSIPDLSSNSTVEGGDTYVPSAGQYTVDSPINISQKPVKSIAIDTGTSLTVSPGSAATMFEAKTITMRGGTLQVTGGNTNYKKGLCGNLVLNSGEVHLSGGNGSKSFGLYLTGSNPGVVVNGGTLYAHGADSANESIGIRGLGGAISQTGGTVYSYGGAGGTYNVGIDVEDYIQTGGKLVAKAGDGRANHGAYFDWDLVIGKELVVQRGGSALAAAVLVGFDENTDYGNKLQFQNGSKLVLDLSGTGRLPVIWANKAEINGNVKLELSDAATLANGSSITHEFLITQYGITGEFAFTNSSTLDISVNKSLDNKKYNFTFTRTGTAGDLATTTPSLDSNSFNLLRSLDPLYGTSISPDIAADLNKIDFMTDKEQIVQHANYMVQKYTPIDSTRITNTALNLNYMTGKSMENNLFAPSGNQLASTASGSSDALASLACPSGTTRSFWVSPLAQWTKTKPLSREFVTATENTYGVGLGFGLRQEYTFAVGAGIHYLRSDLNSHTADIDSDIYGFNLFGRKYFANRSSWHPFVQGGVGYSYSDSKQVRKILNNHSSPSTHIINTNLALGSDIESGRFTYTPKIGVDHNYIRTGSYTENGTNALAVRSSDINSVRGVAGLAVKGQVNDCFYVTANADYRYEFGDRNSTTRSALAQMTNIRFVTKGEKRSRSSGNMGAGFGWQVRSNVLVNMNYDFGISEKQHSHAVAARLTLDF